MSAQEEIAILVAAIGGHQVTMTNPKLGTVQVGRRGYNMFRRIVADRGVVAMEDTQSEVLCELIACFEAARSIGNDTFDNRLLLDKDTGLLFVIEDERRVLVAVYDKRAKRSKKKGALKRQAA